MLSGFDITMGFGRLTPHKNQYKLKCSKNAHTAISFEQKLDVRKKWKKCSKRMLALPGSSLNENTVSAYLPGTEVNRDQEGGSSRARPFHCTSVGLTSTITPNVGNSSA